MYLYPASMFITPTGHRNWQLFAVPRVVEYRMEEARMSATIAIHWWLVTIDLPAVSDKVPPPRSL